MSESNDIMVSIICPECGRECNESEDYRCDGDMYGDMVYAEKEEYVISKDIIRFILLMR